jgi:hypothetical protein
MNASPLQSWPFRPMATIRTLLQPTRAAAEDEFLEQYPLHCTIVGVDIHGFGNGHRDDEVQLHLRKALYELLERAFAEAGVPWGRCRHEDRGDGVLIIVPPDIPTPRLIDPLAGHVHAGLRRHNKMASIVAQIRLRMAVHAGPVYRDKHGVSGQAVLRLFRLLEAPVFKCVFATNGATFGLIVSEYVYDTVVRHGLGLIDPDTYSELQVRSKETETQAWLHLPSRAELPPPRSQPR